MCCDILSVDCTGEWFFWVFLRSNFFVIRGLRRSLDFRAVIGYWDSRSGSGMTIVMWSGMTIVMGLGMTIVMSSG